jgi:hypothetical protein
MLCLGIRRLDLGREDAGREDDRRSFLRRREGTDFHLLEACEERGFLREGFARHRSGRRLCHGLWLDLLPLGHGLGRCWCFGFDWPRRKFRRRRHSLGAGSAACGGGGAAAGSGSAV